MACFSRMVLPFCLLLLAGQIGAQQRPAISVRNLMTTDEFQQAGLHKLNSEELAVLDAWFTRTALALLSGTTSPPFSPGQRALDFSNLEGAIIVAEDGQFLGTITTNPFDSQSIGNAIGRYGSSISSTSIFNEIGRYGGEISRMSPFNSITSTPPRIYKNDQFIAYLTVNTIKTPRVDPRALMGWIKANQ